MKTCRHSATSFTDREREKSFSVDKRRGLMLGYFYYSTIAHLRADWWIRPQYAPDHTVVLLGSWVLGLGSGSNSEYDNIICLVFFPIGRLGADEKKLVSA